MKRPAVLKSDMLTTHPSTCSSFTDFTLFSCHLTSFIVPERISFRGSLRDLCAECKHFDALAVISPVGGDCGKCPKTNMHLHTLLSKTSNIHVGGG